MAARSNSSFTITSGNTPVHSSRNKSSGLGGHATSSSSRSFTQEQQGSAPMHGIVAPAALARATSDLNLGPTSTEEGMLADEVALDFASENEQGDVKVGVNGANIKNEDNNIFTIASSIPTTTTTTTAVTSESEKSSASSKKDGVRKAKVTGQTDEASEHGAVGLRHYLLYFVVGTNKLGLAAKLGLVVLTSIASQLSRMLIDYWVVLWGADSPTTSSSNHSLSWWQATTGLLIAICFSILFIRLLIYLFVAIQASRGLHDANFAKVLRAPMVWFDVTPVGQIMNRFSKDM